MKDVIYYFGLIQLLLLQVFVFKPKTYYEDDDKQNRRLRGSAIIISNHRSFMDGIVLALRLFFNRPHFLATDFYKNKRRFLKLVVNIAGGIFVDEETVRFGFIEECKRVAAKGRPILIFPEGGFSQSYEPSAFSAGYIMLAVKTGARIVPIVNDFNYGLFKRVHLLIGNSIDLSCYSASELTQAKQKEINEKISEQYLMLYYKLKRKKAERFSEKFDFIPMKKGDVIRVSVGTHCHYGVYLNSSEVIQFGRAVNQPGESIVVNSVSLNEFCGGKIPEVRTLKRRERKYIRDTDDIERYAKHCLGQGGYSIANNNCLDFANRVTLRI